MMTFNDLIGLEIEAVKGFSSSNTKKKIKPVYILFNDGETILELVDQSELPTHAKAMGWASGFNGRAT